MPEPGSRLCNCYAADVKDHTEDDHLEDCVAQNFGVGVECGVCLGCNSSKAVRETSDPVPPAPGPVFIPGAVPVLLGTVKFFLPERSYGFIVGDDGEEPFVWYRDIIRGKTNEFRILVKGLRVSYKLSANPKGPKAVDVRVLGDQTEEVWALFNHAVTVGAVQRERELAKINDKEKSEHE